MNVSATHSFQSQGHQTRQPQHLVLPQFLPLPSQQPERAESPFERRQERSIGVDWMRHFHLVAGGEAALDVGVAVEEAVQHFAAGVVH